MERVCCIVSMARQNPNRIPYPRQEQLLEMLVAVIHRLPSKAAVRNFFKDILNRQERLMLVRRLQVAQLLVAGKTYREIETKLRVSPNTIARIERWVHFGRGGYRAAIAVLKGKSR